QPAIKLYSSSDDQVSAFWIEKFENDASKYWDIFYKHHQDKFFKDRHYLRKEWGHYLSLFDDVHQVGCGAGNTTFPLLAAYPNLFVYACDFSPRAVNLVKMHKEFTEDRVHAFICDLTIDDLCLNIPASSVDIVTMIFVLSAVSPDKMPMVLQNIRKVLKPNGIILFRDYATGDLAQERFKGKERKISDNFYVRGDGTRAFYFSDEFLKDLFLENGFIMTEHLLYCKKVENRLKNLVMNRRWVQAVFQTAEAGSIDDKCEADQQTDCADESEIVLSEGMAAEMFGFSSSNEEIVEASVGNFDFKIKVLSKEYQHTCPSTGLMLWESARLMASTLASNQAAVSRKRVLELGCGCSGICSMIAAAASADIVVATDGDQKALDFLMENINSNLRSPFLDRLHVQRLKWGDEDDTEAVRKLNDDDGFDIIIGTDVVYNHDSIQPLFATARGLISEEEEEEAALILCHVYRGVDEASIVSAASANGFRLVQKWGRSSEEWRIGKWFLTEELQRQVQATALNVLYFSIA
ncbi:hypothetical protein M569_05940, partial [Genlisea aurea]